MPLHDEQSIFQVDEKSDLPIWVQLRNRFALLIKTGQFEEGDQLPSVRSLAAEAGINYNTVTRAYRDLELEGLVASVRGRGMFVQRAPNAGDASTEPVDALFEDVVRQYRAIGMTYDDINRHISAIVQKMNQESADASARREELGR